MLSYNLDPFELGWELVFKTLSIMGALLPVIPIANHWQWVTSSGVNLVITGGLFIGSIVFIAYFSIAAISVMDVIDPNYASDELEVINMMIIISYLIATPFMIGGGIYAYILPIDEKGHYSLDKLFSINAQEIPTIKTTV